MRGFISKFYQAPIIIVFIVIFVSCSSLKQNKTVSTQDSEEQTQEVNPEWLECKASVDCIKVKGFCKLPAVIHKKYKDNFLAFVKQGESPIDCKRYKNINYSSIVETACENKQCKLIIP